MSDQGWERFNKVNDLKNQIKKLEAELAGQPEINITGCIITGKNPFLYKILPNPGVGFDIKTIVKIDLINYRIMPLEDFKKIEDQLSAAEKKRDFNKKAWDNTYKNLSEVIERLESGQLINDHRDAINKLQEENTKIKDLNDKYVDMEDENAKLQEQLTEMEKNLQRNGLGEWKK